MAKQVKHVRTSKLGKKFLAGSKHNKPKQLPMDWKSVAKRELEEMLEVKTHVTNYSYYTEKGALSLESISGKANNGESEWIIFKTYTEAKQAAIEKVRDDLEQEPELFTQSWLENFIDKKELKTRLWDDVYSMNFDQITDENPTWSEDKVEKEANEATSNQLEDPIQYLEDIYGKEEAIKKAIEIAGIDVQEAAEDAVTTDGVEHFLDVYDGSWVELPSGAVAFGTN